MAPRTRTKRPFLVEAGTALATGGAVFLLFWHHDALQLHPLGSHLAWPAMVSFGLVAAVSPADVRRAGAGLVLGSLLGVLAVFVGLSMLPLTPFGEGVGLGIGAAVLTGVSLAARRWFQPAACAMGFGVGVAGAQVVDITVLSGFMDVVSLWTAMAVAFLVGLVMAEVLSLVRRRMSRPVEAREIRLPEPVSSDGPAETPLASTQIRLPEAGSARVASPAPSSTPAMDAPVYGPILEPPDRFAPRKEQL